MNGSIGGCINLLALSLPSGAATLMSSGLSGMLSLCGSTCGALAGMVGGLLGGGGGGITEALPAVMKNAGGGK